MIKQNCGHLIGNYLQVIPPWKLMYMHIWSLECSKEGQGHRKFDTRAILLTAGLAY
jgi:hypothetical protein